MQRFARALTPSARLAFRSGAVRPTVPKFVVMSEAALKDVPAPAKAPVVDSAVNWDKIAAQIKGDALKKQLEEVKGLDISVQEQKAGSIDYQAVRPISMRDFDWAALNEVVTSDEGKRKLAEFKSVVSEIHEWIRENDKPVEEIDWRHYHKTLDPVVPGFVDQCRKSVEDVFANSPDIDLSPQVAQIKSLSQAMHGSVETYCQGIAEVQALIQTDLQNLKTERSVPDMTTEEVMALYPELAAEIESEIAHGQW